MKNWCHWCVIKHSIIMCIWIFLNICNQILNFERDFTCENSVSLLHEVFYLLVGIFLWKLYIKDLETSGHGILIKQKAAQHYCQNTFKKAVHRKMCFTFRYLLSQKQRNLRRKKKSVVKATYFLHLMS